MDRKPKYLHQTLVLVWTLLDLAGVRPEQIVVHAIDGCDEAVLSSLRELGIRLLTVQPFARGFPNCNKLQQLASPELLEAEACVLLDTDTAILKDISWAASSSHVRARPVGGPFPPIDMLGKIFKAAGFGVLPAGGETAFEGHPTLRVNCNGGVYFLPRHALAELSTEWPKRARWLIERSSELLPEHLHFTLDQVSFGLACHALGLDIDLLPLEMNYQIRATKPNADLSPFVLHYHSRVDPSGLLRPIGQPRVDRAIEEVNGVIRRRRRLSFDSRLFWDFLHSTSHDAGERLESSGVDLTHKRRLLREQLGHTPNASVLDIGCGDLETTRELPITTYTGVDISEEAVRIAKEKRPFWTFLSADARFAAVYPHDVVLCLDVLIHQPTRAEYDALLSRLVALTRKSLLVSGYTQPPSHVGEGTFFHEPLTSGLLRLAPGKTPSVLGSCRDIAILRLDLDEHAHPPPEPAGSTREVLRVETPYGVFNSYKGDLFTTQLQEYGAHTRNELAMLLSFVQEGNLVLDIGAHIGTYAIPLARAVGAQGRLVAVEPDPVSLELLRANVRMNGLDSRIEIVESLVSDEDKGFRKVFNPSNTGLTHFMEDGGASSVPVASLDELWRTRAGSRPVNVIKIDTEGMELPILRSGCRLFAESRPILYLEVVEMHLRRHGHGIADLQEWLTGNGYALYRNSGRRNSDNDLFSLVSLPNLGAGGSFFDCLAVPRERVGSLRLPRA